MHQDRELGDREHTLGWLPAHGETFCGNRSFPAIDRVPETVCPCGVFWVQADSSGRGTINHARGVSAAAAGEVANSSSGDVRASWSGPETGLWSSETVQRSQEGDSP